MNRIFRAVDVEIVIVQEPCLLAMLRLAADCEEIPKQVTQTVSKVAQNASRHIRHVSRAEIGCMKN